MRARRKKSQLGTTLLFTVLAIILVASAGVLAVKLPDQVKELKEVKETLQTLEASQNDLEASLEEVESRLEEVKQETETLKSQLEEAKKQNPEVTVTTDPEGKYAYLTFDDGPSDNTIKILDFLKANEIPATFFVLGKENRDDVYKRIVEEGHTLAVHSNTHDYQDIYKSVDNFIGDMNALANQLESVTGVRPNVMRFPGGSNNTIHRRYGGEGLMDQIIPAVESEGFVYFDWNVDSMDAATNKQSKDVIVNSVLNGSKGKKQAVILMHDAAPKTTTVDALPEIVEGLRKQGFIFRALTNDTPLVQFK